MPLKSAVCFLTLQPQIQQESENSLGVTPLLELIPVMLNDH